MIIEQRVAVVVEIAHQRHVDAHAVELLADVGHLLGRLGRVDRDAHQLGASLGQLDDLADKAKVSAVVMVPELSTLRMRLLVSAKYRLPLLSPTTAVVWPSDALVAGPPLPGFALPPPATVMMMGWPPVALKVTAERPVTERRCRRPSGPTPAPPGRARPLMAPSSSSRPVV